MGSVSTVFSSRFVRAERAREASQEKLLYCWTIRGTYTGYESRKARSWGRRCLLNYYAYSFDSSVSLKTTTPELPRYCWSVLLEITNSNKNVMDPLSITVSIIGLLQAVSSTCETLKTIKDLPKAFEHVETHLPLVQKTLGDIQNNLRLRTLADGQRQSIGQILEHCQENGEKLKNIFDALKDKFQKDADSKSWGKLRGWYRTALQGVKGHRVESLMANILRDLEKLSLYESFSLATREDIKGIKKALGDISEVEPSLEDSEFPQKASFSNVQNISEDGYGQQNTPAGGQNTFNSGKYNITGGGQTINFVEQVMRNPEQTFSLIPAGIPDPKFATKRIRNQRGKLLKTCYEWIIANDDFKQWRDEADRRLLWVRGDAGKGKTMLLCGIAETFEDVKSMDNQARTPIYFFCDATDDQLNTAESVMQGLLAFLIDKSSHPRSKYLDSNSKYRHDWEMLVQKVEDVLQDFDGEGVYLIVDALDECIDGRQKLLKAIVKISGSILEKVKILVSSRNLTNIEDELSCSEVIIDLSLERNKPSVDDAIDFFIADQVTALAKRKRYPDDLRDKIREYLKSNAHDTFLWVALVCKELAKCQLVDSTYEMLKSNFPPELNGIYGRMVESINHSSENPRLCKQILAIACAVYRPINWGEMKSLLGNTTRNSLTSVIGMCGSFLSIQDDDNMDDDNKMINFVHLSAKDLLVQNQDASKQILPHGLIHQHCYISEKSIKNLSVVLKRDIYALKEPTYPVEEVSAPAPDPLASVRYSCIYWPSHLLELDGPVASTKSSSERRAISSQIDSDSNGLREMIKDDGIVQHFIAEKYLYWLEALSLLSEIPEGVRAMERLEFFLRDGESRELYTLIDDARRFILLAKGGIEIAPLQAYESALIFSPKNSLIKRLFSREYPSWVELRPRVKDNWNACLQILEIPLQHPTGAFVAFSNDDQQLFAWGDDDGTIMVFDPITGKDIRKLRVHLADAWSIAFSPDGNQMASCSLDTTIKLWDISSWECIQTYECHAGMVPQIFCFSPCSQKIASASEGGVIKIWHTISGECTHTFTGAKHIQTLAFSDTSHLILSDSQSCVYVWDMHLSNCVRTIKLDEVAVGSVVFSSNSQQVASGGSRYHDIKIWDIASGNCERILEGHTDRIDQTAFSKDSQRLASSSQDSTVRIWDLNTGVCVRTFKNERSEITSLTFSNYGHRVATGHCLGEIFIWDMDMDYADCDRIDRHNQCISSLAWSNDGQRVATGSVDESVKVWDATNGTCLRTLTGHIAPVCSLDWSSDDNRVASGTWRDIRVWDTNSGNCLFKLKSKERSLHISVALSSDGQRVAFCGWFDKVHVWDVISRKCLLTRRNTSEHNGRVALSNDGSLVVSSSCEETAESVREWNIQSGICTRTIYTKGRVNSLSYDPNDPAWLIWNEDDGSQGLGISQDGTWLIQDGKNLCWVPPDYRSEGSKEVAAAGPRIAIGCDSGHVLILGIRAG